MESLKLKTEIRNKLYYGKYRYRAKLSLLGVNYTYYTPDIETFLFRKEKFENDRISGFIKYNNDDWTNYWRNVDIDKISMFLTWRNTVPRSQAMIRIQSDQVSFFSNDLKLLQSIESIDTNVEYTEVCNLSNDVMYFKKEPKYKYRTFFKGKRMPEYFIDSLQTVRNNYPDIKISPALQSLVFNRSYHPFRYMHGSYFIDYNQESMLSILAMFFPDMLAKTFTLAKHP